MTRLGREPRAAGNESARARLYRAQGPETGRTPTHARRGRARARRAPPPARCDGGGATRARAPEDELVIAVEELRDALDHARRVDLLSLEVFHDVEELVVDLGLVAELHLDLVEVQERVLDLELAQHLLQARIVGSGRRCSRGCVVPLFGGGCARERHDMRRKRDLPALAKHVPWSPEASIRRGGRGRSAAECLSHKWYTTSEAR